MFRFFSLAIIAGAVAVLYYNSLHKIVPGPIVSTTNGPVQGIVSKTRDGKIYYQYNGIPYAKPPIGELRYEAPQPLDSHWTEVRDVSTVGNSCLQINIFQKKNEGHEDCLFLNVFTPEIVKAGGKLRKTMVWIHGGAFVSGTSTMYGGDYFLDEDILLVTINYRLGALGFLNTEDGLVRGNMGLKDQSMALRWVKQNIANFGGDPNDVLIFGESAGAVSVHYHLLSSMSKGLFSKAIAQSGVALSSWAVNPNPIRYARRYAKNVNCPTENTKEMVVCLKSLSPEQLLKGHQETLDVLKDSESLFGPSIETILDKNSFITEHPQEAVKKGLSVPVLFGYNSHEGLLTSATIVRDQEIMKKFDNNFNKVMADFLFYPSTDRKAADAVMEKVRNFYFGKTESIGSFDKFENFTNIVTDYLFALGFYNNAKYLQQQESPAYLYYYTFQGQFTLTNVLLALKGKFPMAVEFIIYRAERFFRERILGETYTHYGTCHGDELALQFKLVGLYDIGTTHRDYLMSKKVVKLWTSFAKGSHPSQFDGVDWIPIQNDKNTLQYLEISEKSAMIPQPNQDRIDFWNSVHP